MYRSGLVVLEITLYEQTITILLLYNIVHTTLIIITTHTIRPTSPDIAYTKLLKNGLFAIDTHSSNIYCYVRQ